MRAVLHKLATNVRSICCTSFSTGCHSYVRVTATSVATKMPAAAFSAQHLSHAGRKVHLGNPSQLVLPISCTPGSRGPTKGFTASKDLHQSFFSSHRSAAGFWARHQGQWARVSTIISRAICVDHSSGKVAPPNQHDSPTQQAQQGHGEAPVGWGLRAVLVGMAATVAVAHLKPFTYCINSLITLLNGLPHDDWSNITLASAVLGKQVLLCAVTVGSLSLLCRRHGTSLPALMQLDFNRPLEVLSIAVLAYMLYSVAAVPTLLGYFMAVYHKVPSASQLQLPPDDIDRILQSGDSPACAMVTLSAVVLAPVIEELVFRGFALQTLMKVWPDRPAFNILVTGAVFGALHTHYPVWGQVACAVRGLALGTVYLWLDRNLLVPITAHALANLVAILSRLNAA